MNTAEKIIALRNEKKMTQYALAKELEIALSSLKNYENIKNPRIPEARVLLKIARYFGVSVEYLIDDNITNKIQENIEINKTLKLDDITISLIKIMSEDTALISSLNSILSSTQVFNIVTNYHVVSNLIILSSLFEEMFEIIDYDKNKKQFFISRLKKDFEILPKVMLKSEHSKYFEKIYIEEKEIYEYLEKYEVLAKYTYFSLNDESFNFNEYLHINIISGRELADFCSHIGFAREYLKNKEYSLLDRQLDKVYDFLYKVSQILFDYSNLISYKINKNVTDMIDDFKDEFKQLHIQELWSKIDKEEILNKKIDIRRR